MPLVARIAAPLLLATPAFAQGGEDAANATPIEAIPFADTGTTIGFLDDADETCPYTGSTSPDVYYAYTPEADDFLTIELCNSSYDTKVYVHDAHGNLAFTTSGQPACNDDGCRKGGGISTRSQLECVIFPAGQTRFIIVDGWGGDAGDYDLAVTRATACTDPCVVECSAGATTEGEPCLFDELRPNDTFNGGCNASPPVFGAIACAETICGEGYFNGTFRDTDWFEIDTSDDRPSTAFTFSGVADFDLILARSPCGSELECTCVPKVPNMVIGQRCERVGFTTEHLPPGVYTFFVAATFTNVFDCARPFGARYEVTLACEDVLPACPWDLTGDQTVGFADLLELLSHWGPCPG